MKFVFSQGVVPEAMALLQGAETKVLNALNMAEHPADIADADALIIRISRVPAEAIAAAGKLRVIGRTGVGFDSIDVAAATARGIPVVLTPGASSRSVAEHTVALLYALSKNLVESHNEQKKGNYQVRSRGVTFELMGKTILVNDYFKGDPFVYGFREETRRIPCIIGSSLAEQQALRLPVTPHKYDWSWSDSVARIRQIGPTRSSPCGRRPTRTRASWIW